MLINIVLATRMRFVCEFYCRLVERGYCVSADVFQVGYSVEMDVSSFPSICNQFPFPIYFDHIIREGITSEKVLFSRSPSTLFPLSSRVYLLFSVRPFNM